MQIFTQVYRVYKAAQAARQTSNELYAMSDRELNDIGLTRGMIPAVTNQIMRDILDGTTDN